NYYSILLNKNNFKLVQDPSLLYSCKATSLKQPYNKVSKMQIKNEAAIVVLKKDKIEIIHVGNNGTIKNTNSNKNYTSSSEKFEDVYYSKQGNIYIISKSLESNRLLKVENKFKIIKYSNEIYSDIKIPFQLNSIDEIYSKIGLKDSVIVLLGINESRLKIFKA